MNKAFFPHEKCDTALCHSVSLSVTLAHTMSVYRRNGGSFSSSLDGGSSNCRKTWYESIMDDIVHRDAVRHSLRINKEQVSKAHQNDISEYDLRSNHIHDEQIGVRFKRTASGTMQESIIPLLEKPGFTDFMEAVQKFTMGETGIASERFYSNEQVQLMPNPPTSVSLTSNCGPFQNYPGIKISGPSSATAYCNLVLDTTFKYLDKSHVFYASFKPSFPDQELKGYCMMHGGLNFQDKMVFEECFNLGMYNIKMGNSLKLDQVSTVASYNAVHQLGFGGSVITGRLEVYEACTASTKARDAMHYAFKTTVVGHTPQWAGMPTIIRESYHPLAQDRFLVCLDTQFSNRQLNSHSLGLFKDGSFVLRGSWMNIIEYEAKSDDYLIGRKFEVEEGRFVIGPALAEASWESKSPYFRIIGKVTSVTPSMVYTSAEYDNMKGAYICVNYEVGNPAHLPGKTSICFVRFGDTPTRSAFISEEMINPRPDIVALMKSFKFVHRGLVFLSHEDLYPIRDYPHDESLTSFIFETDNDVVPYTFVCGDIEASVDFLNGFLKHSFGMLSSGDPYENFGTFKASWSASNTYKGYGFESDANRGFQLASVSDEIKKVYYLTDRIQHMRRSVNFACIGDVIGDPVGDGTGNRTKTQLIHEFICIHWAYTSCKILIAGNRDINKLRLLNEIYFAFEDRNQPHYNTIVSKFNTIRAMEQKTHLFPPNMTDDEKKQVLLAEQKAIKQVLGHMCYPAVEVEGQMMSKHYTRDKLLPLPAPPPIWANKFEPMMG